MSFTSNAILGADVDSTVWDTGARVREATLEVTGYCLAPGSVATWTDLLNAFGEEATTEIHALVNSPARVRERKPYPGAAEVLRYLQSERGISIHFVSRVSEPERIGPALEAWLRENFGPRVGLTMTKNDKLPILRELGAFGMVDDRPDTLRGVAAAGMWSAAKIQPWNEDVVAGLRDIHGFHDWREVPTLLPGAFGDVTYELAQTGYHERIWS